MNSLLDFFWPRYTVAFESDRGTDYGTVMVIKERRDGVRQITERAFVSRGQKIPRRFTHPSTTRAVNIIGLIVAGLAMGKIAAIVIAAGYP